MGFLTKIDISDNRQSKQYIETTTHYSGTTIHGVPFDMLPTGPSTTDSGITSTVTNAYSSFSGNSGTTLFSWYDTRMNLATGFSAITPTNSGVTQNTGLVFTPNLTGTSLDGYPINLTYSGVSFDVQPTYFIDLGGGAYSGSLISTNISFLSAGTIDFTGTTIWLDVSGITRTNGLIFTNNPVIGYVLTCTDADGTLTLEPSSGSSATTVTTYWSAGTGTPSVSIKNFNSISSGNYSISEGFNTTASGNISHTEGSGNTASGIASHAEGSTTAAVGVAAHAEGFRTTASGNYSHTEGTLTSAVQAAHAEGWATTASGLYSHSEGLTTTASGDYSHAEGGTTTAIGLGAHAEGYQTVTNGIGAHAEGYQTTANSIATHAEGRGTTASGDYSHAGGISSRATGYSSFVYGSGSTASGVSSIVLGNNITGSTDNTTYVDNLNIKTVGVGPGITDIGVDGNGFVVNQASDLRLKKNISTIENALDKVKRLRGVKYQWNDELKGGSDYRLGFIAQEVSEVEPLLSFVNTTTTDNYMGVLYKDVPALLVEAIKELVSDEVVINKTYLETQSIIAEDNNIDLNYGGTKETAINGGIRVINGLGSKNAELILDVNGDWVTNNGFKPKNLTLPTKTPSSTKDTMGNVGDLVFDDNFIYIKTNTGWKKTLLIEF